MDNINFTDPVLLGFVALALGGLFLPQVKSLLSKIRLPSKPDDTSKPLPNTLQDAENLAREFATRGDEENTMLATAMMVGIIKEREKDILQYCAECKSEQKRGEPNWQEDQHDE